MREFIFYFLFGMLSLTGMFLSVFWTSKTVKRCSSLGFSRDDLQRDRYFWLCAALSLTSVGSVLIYGARTWSNVRYGLSQTLYGWEGMMIGGGLAVLLLGMAVMVRLADLEYERAKWLWGMGLITVVWTVACVWLADMGASHFR